MIQGIRTRSLRVPRESGTVLTPLFQPFVELVGRGGKGRLLNGLDCARCRAITTDNAVRPTLQQIVNIDVGGHVHIRPVVHGHLQIIDDGANRRGTQFLRRDSLINRTVTEEGMRARDGTDPYERMPVTLLVADQLLFHHVAAQPFGNAIAVCVQTDIHLGAVVQFVGSVGDAYNVVLTVRTEQCQRLGIPAHVVAR